MSVFADQAVVLLRYDYSETSQIVALMTRDHGVVRAIAKGIKRGTKTRFATGRGCGSMTLAASSVSYPDAACNAGRQ